MCVRAVVRACMRVTVNVTCRVMRAGGEGEGTEDLLVLLQTLLLLNISFSPLKQIVVEIATLIGTLEYL